jgi:hypothetical protein
MILVPDSVCPGDQELLTQAAHLSEYPNIQDYSRSSIQEFSQHSGIELATALLYDRITRQPSNGDFMRRVQADTAAPSHLPLIGIVPGAFYRNHTNTGADGAAVVRILEGLGCRVECVPVESFGSLATNAKIIRRWLEQRRGQSIALMSLSKGTADVKVALGMPDAMELFRNVAIWVSISGLPQGTPLVAWLNRQPLRRLGVKLVLWWRRQSYSVIEELSDSPGSTLKSWPALPQSLKIIHIVGFPLRRHLTHPWAPRGYERVRALGPNDGGGFLLADSAGLPGIILPIWGADHYLQPAWDVAALFRRVLSAALSLAVEEAQASLSASKPSSAPASKSSA